MTDKKFILKEETIKFLTGLGADASYIERIKEGAACSEILKELSVSGKYNEAQSIRLNTLSTLAKAMEVVNHLPAEEPVQKKPIMPFAELEKKHWCTNAYHRHKLFNYMISDGVKEFIEAYDADWIINSIMRNPDVVNFKYGHFPRIEVEYKNDRLHEVRCFYGMIDEDGEDLKDENPFDVAQDLDFCLPEGKLYFEVGIGDEKGTPVICLMSEH